MLLQGLFLPLLTPFYADGRLYLRKLEHNAERYSRTLASGLAVLTPAGEPSRLTEEERREVLKTAAQATAKGTVLLADVSHGGVAGCLAMAETAATAGYDAVLLRLPTLDSGATEAEQRMLAEAVADRSPLPLVLADELREGISSSLLVSVAEHANVLGWVAGASDVQAVKEVLARTQEIKREVTVTTIFEAVTGRMLQREPTRGDGSFISAGSLSGVGVTALAEAPPEPAIKTRMKQVGFQVLAGRTRDLLALLRAGASGGVLPFGACAPQACHEVVSAWKDEDELLAEEKYERIVRGAALTEEELGIAGLKAAADLNGYFGGSPRLPGVPLLAEQIQRVQAVMRGMRN